MRFRRYQLHFIIIIIFKFLVKLEKQCMNAFIQIDDISLTDDTKRSFQVKPVSKFYCRCISCICCCHYKLIIFPVIWVFNFYMSNFARIFLRGVFIFVIILQIRKTRNDPRNWQPIFLLFIHVIITWKKHVQNRLIYKTPLWFKYQRLHAENIIVTVNYKKVQLFLLPLC